jgi:hypothetical protein
MNHLKRRGSAHYTATLNAKKPGCFDEKKRPKPFAAAEARVTHRVDEAFRAKRFSRQRLRGQEIVERLFRRFGNVLQTPLEFIRTSRRHRLFCLGSYRFRSERIKRYLI